jgi:hypothetical protein
MTAGGKDQADLLEGSDVRWNRARDLIGECLDHQWMGRIDVVVMEYHAGTRPASLGDRMSKSLAL